MTITQQSIDFLTDIGQKLQSARDTLASIEKLTVESDLPNPFVDGALSAELEIVEFALDAALELVTAHTAQTIYEKAEQEIRSLKSGEAYEMPDPKEPGDLEEEEGLN